MSKGKNLEFNTPYAYNFTVYSDTRSHDYLQYNNKISVNTDINLTNFYISFLKLWIVRQQNLKFSVKMCFK